MSQAENQSSESWRREWPLLLASGNALTLALLGKAGLPLRWINP